MCFAILADKTRNIEIDAELVSKVENVYNARLPEEIKKIVSLSNEPVFYDGWRALSSKEILNATEYLEFDFVKKKLLPLIDAFDNNFIAYSLKESCWEYVNIIDEIEYAQSPTLEDLL